MTDDERYSRPNYKRYHEWLKFIGEARPELPPGYLKVNLLVYCHRMAEMGKNGMGCYAGDAVIARQLDLNRDTVAKYKALAVKLGWFVETGKRKGRAKILDFNIPAEGDDAYRPAPAENAQMSKPAPATEHDRSVWPSDCEACKPHLDDSGSVPDSVYEAHLGVRFTDSIAEPFSNQNEPVAEQMPW